MRSTPTGLLRVIGAWKLKRLLHEALRYIHTDPLVATTSGRYLWLKNNVRPLQRHKWLDHWQSSSEDKMHFFVFSYFVAATSVNRVYTHVYYNVQSVVSPQKVVQPPTRQRHGKKCGHSHLCTYKVSVSATCGHHKQLRVNVPLFDSPVKFRISELGPFQFSYASNMKLRGLTEWGSKFQFIKKL